MRVMLAQFRLLMLLLLLPLLLLLLLLLLMMECRLHLRPVILAAPRPIR